MLNAQRSAGGGRWEAAGSRQEAGPARPAQTRRAGGKVVCVTGVRRGECRAVAAVHGAVVGGKGKVGQGRCLPRMLGAGTGALVMGSTRDERLRRGEAAVWGAGPLAVR